MAGLKTHAASVTHHLVATWIIEAFKWGWGLWGSIMATLVLSVWGYVKHLDPFWIIVGSIPTLLILVIVLNAVVNIWLKVRPRKVLPAEENTQLKIQPELEYVGPEFAPNWDAKAETFGDRILVKARFHHKPKLGSNPNLAVRAEISFYSDDKLRHQVFKARWLGAKDAYKSFSYGDAHDLLICDATKDGDAIMTYEHATLPTCLYGKQFSIKILLFGEWKHQIRITTETELTITLNPGLGVSPKVDLVKHSIVLPS